MLQGESRDGLGVEWGVLAVADSASALLSVTEVSLLGVCGVGEIAGLFDGVNSPFLRGLTLDGERDVYPDDAFDHDRPDSALLTDTSMAREGSGSSAWGMSSFSFPISAALLACLDSRSLSSA